MYTNSSLIVRLIALYFTLSNSQCHILGLCVNQNSMAAELMVYIANEHNVVINFSSQSERSKTKDVNLSYTYRTVLA